MKDSFDNQVVKVNTLTYKYLVDNYGEPDFVKFDVEGFEDKVINGMDEVSNKTSFLIEIRNETKATVYNYFNSRLFNCYLIGKDSLIKVNSIEKVPSFANLIFTKSKI